MQSSINKDGFLPVQPDDLVEEGDPPFADAPMTAGGREMHRDHHALQHEIALLRVRIGLLKDDAEAILKAKATSIDADAHVQLGNYPWLKLAAAFSVAFVAGRLIRNLPVGIPLAGAAADRHQRRIGLHAATREY